MQHRKPGFTVVQRDNQFRVFDQDHKFRCSFSTMTQAQAYIASHTPHRGGSGITPVLRDNQAATANAGRGQFLPSSENA